jgi:hypothetical protein
MEKQIGSDRQDYHNSQTIPVEQMILICKCGYTAIVSFYPQQPRHLDENDYWKCRDCGTGYSWKLIQNERKFTGYKEDEMRYMDDPSKYNPHRRLVSFYEFNKFDADKIETENQRRKRMGTTNFIHEITEEDKRWAASTNAKPEKNLAEEPEY